ncbi:Lipid A export ATP-binding/permease protein MsbA [uncultured Candidatus Thioglobus sp.]|nr:Lipid A export ATP-binding/permease protein MsbA [uncultured Candidatus Thioglobus sp.]
MGQSNEDYDNQSASLSILKRLLPYLSSMRYRIIIALLLLISAKLASIATPLLLKQIIDDLDQPDIILVLPIGLLLAFGSFWLLSSLFNELRDAIFAKVRYRAMNLISSHVFTHLHNLDLAFHLDRRIGAISRDINRGAQSASTLLSILIFNILPSLFEVSLVIGLLLFNYEPIFAIVALTTVILYLTFTLMITKWRIKYRYQMNDLESKANTYAMDSLINYETVKYFNAEQFETKRYQGLMGKWEKIAIKSFTSMTVLNFAQSAVIGTGITGILILAANGVVEGKMTLGDMILIQALLLQLFLPLGALGIVYRQIKHNLIDMRNVFGLLDTKPKINDANNATKLIVTQGEVQFKQVGFSHNQRTVFENLNFSIKAKQKVAIVGASGVGKSTLAKLLFRFYDLNTGQILIDNQDISNTTQHSLRTQIAMVAQDNVLFNQSIYDNIIYAKPNATKDQVIAVTKSAYLWDFIQSLPNGFDTEVGERGLKLSGGEKQRLSIARALLKNPKIFIFDEATSALDSNAEKMVQTAMKTLKNQVTMLVIAHRLSTIVDADNIIVLGNHSVLESGTHQDLLNKQGEYAKLWQLQTKLSTYEPCP